MNLYEFIYDVSMRLKSLKKVPIKELDSEEDTMTSILDEGFDYCDKKYNEAWFIIDLDGYNEFYKPGKLYKKFYDMAQPIIRNSKLTKI